jgi:kynurenine formamidase
MKGPSLPVLSQLVAGLEAGTIRVVDLTQPLGPETPVIGLPPMFASSPGVTLELISRFDDRGPAWYWNTIRMGEHTGTHFDAPIHWITGKDLPDNACDTIPARRFVGPACVIDVTADVAVNPDFLLLPEHVLAWEQQHNRIPSGAWVLLRRGRSRCHGV